MLHPVLSRLPPGYTKLCRRTGILCCTSAFGIDTNPFSRVHASGVRMCVTADRNQNISYGISLALQNIALLFWQPSLRKKKQKTNKHKNKTQTTSQQKVSHYFSSLCPPRRHALAKQTHAPPTLTPPAHVPPLKHGTVHAAPECSHSPCTRV